MHACILQGFPTINQATENWFAEALQKVILTTQRLVITVQVFVSRMSVQSDCVVVKLFVQNIHETVLSCMTMNFDSL